MNIRNFRDYFFMNIRSRGSSYYNTNRIKSVKNIKRGEYQAIVKGSGKNKYTVNVHITPSGDITSLNCSCAYADTDLHNCKHMYAVLMYMENIYESEISTDSSPEILQIINDYTDYAVLGSEEQLVRIVPELSFYDDYLMFKMKIGREKTYVVSDIYNLLVDFQYNYTRKYGKNFEFRHNYSAIDEKSRKFLELATSIYYDQRNRSNDRKNFPLADEYIERFLKIFEGDPLIISGKQYDIEYQNPPVDIVMKSDNKERMSVTMKHSLMYLGYSSHGYFISKATETLYISDTNFTTKVCPFMQMLPSSKTLYIGKNDIPSFYNAVIRQIEQYVNIESSELADDIIPPQMNACLYIDVNSSDEICGRLEYMYDDKSYPAFYDSNTNPFCDRPSEKIALNAVTRYFEVNEDDDTHPFIITDESGIFEFISTGMSSLSKTMELYVSDRFKRINVRQPVHANVGIKTSSGLLELDFGAEGYTKEELLELLQAYRLGRKYHRFKDGSFSLINESMDELSLVTKELNITDKMFLKDNITVPMYRMIYLNSLQSNLESMRVSRSRDFKKLIESYENSLNFDEEQSIPGSLDGIMRDYQKIGFEWFKTLSKYRLGGILADDMGLGKTIQAIALMLSAKENSNEHRQCLVISPSSLTINWENEIKKFAPSLDAVCLNGSAAERKKLFEEIDKYDVIITSYSTILRDIDKYEDRTFAIQFIDEAQNIKNHNTQSAKAVKAIKSDLRFALTGTPVENTLAELWSIFDFVMPGYLYNYSYFKKNYETPIVKKNDEKAVKSLQRLTSPFILRRLKKEVLTELPEKTETILYTEMEKEQKKIYTANAAQIRGELKELDSTDKIKILAMLTRLRQLCCDPALVYENYDGGSAKLEQCIELVKSCIEAGHKILLFSQFTTMLDIISRHFEEEGISYYTLTGKTKARERLKLVNEFNGNDVGVFLISLKAGGTGLNLTGADIVIHYDPWWNISAENQASDRVYRIGQKNNVQIYKLIVKNTIEEKIRELQQKKSDLFDVAVNGDGDIMNMSTEAVMSLLE